MVRANDYIAPAHFNVLWGIKTGHADYENDYINHVKQNTIGAEVDFRLFRLPFHFLFSYTNHRAKDDYYQEISRVDFPNDFFLDGFIVEGPVSINVNEYKIGIRKYLRKRKFSAMFGTGYVQVDGSLKSSITTDSTFHSITKDEISAHGYFLQTAFSYDVTSRLYAGVHLGFSSAVDKGNFDNPDRGGVLISIVIGVRI